MISLLCMYLEAMVRHNDHIYLRNTLQTCIFCLQ